MAMDSFPEAPSRPPTGAGPDPDAMADPEVGHADLSVDERLRLVQRRIADAAQAAGRSPQAITLVAVSKRFEAERVLAAHRAGLVDFGEVRAQELTPKAAEVGSGVRWHFVGRLQRNKVSDVVGLATLIHSVDRLVLAEAIDRRARELSRVQRVLLQVNVADDPAKAGVSEDDALAMIERIRQLRGVACEGLMTIPAFDTDPRPAFARLRRLRDQARSRFPEIQHLSMGMTRDLEAAVAEGATIVRVGEGVFGPRRADSP